MVDGPDGRQTISEGLVVGAAPTTVRMANRRYALAIQTGYGSPWRTPELPCSARPVNLDDHDDSTRPDDPSALGDATAESGRSFHARGESTVSKEPAASGDASTLVNEQPMLLGHDGPGDESAHLRCGRVNADHRGPTGVCVGGGDESATTARVEDAYPPDVTRDMTAGTTTSARAGATVAS